MPDQALPREHGRSRRRSERTVKWLSPPDSPFLVYAELKHYGVPHSRKHLLDLMKRDKFPAARQLSANRVAWLKTEILDYVANRPISRALRPKPAADAPKAEHGGAA
jgi:predicted DNA-binding transcriptional regulator AlpA